MKSALTPAEVAARDAARRERKRAYDHARRAAFRETGKECRPQKAIAPGTAIETPDDPQCAGCGSRDLWKRGVSTGRQRYQCKTCGRQSFGTPPVVVPPWPCPYCGRQCVKGGKAWRGRQQYWCLHGCGRRNTELWPEEPKPAGGPFLHVKTFYLGYAAAQKLMAYCNATGQNVPQAMRTLLRQAAEAPVFASARRVSEDDGRRTIIEVRSARPNSGSFMRRAAVKLPDLRAETARARMVRPNEIRYRPTVLVVQKVRLGMDEKAWAGLLATMARTGKTHQAAARFLVERAKLPGEVTVAVGRAV